MQPKALRDKCWIFYIYCASCARLNDLYQAPQLSNRSAWTKKTKIYKISQIPALFHQQMFSIMGFNNFDIADFYS